MKVDMLEIDIHTNIKDLKMSKEMSSIAEAKELFDLLSKHIEIPKNVQSLTLKLDMDSAPIIIVTSFAEKKNG